MERATLSPGEGRLNEGGDFADDVSLSVACLACGLSASRWVPVFVLGLGRRFNSPRSKSR